MSRARRWRLAAVLLCSGMAFTALGLVLFPDSNLGGGLPLLGAPVATFGVIMLVVLTIVSVVERMERSRRAPRDKGQA
jgi:hypothetical protein